MLSKGNVKGAVFMCALLEKGFQKAEVSERATPLEAAEVKE